jgi:hypothetical protein
MEKLMQIMRQIIVVEEEWDTSPATAEARRQRRLAHLTEEWYEAFELYASESGADREYPPLDPETQYDAMYDACWDVGEHILPF